MSHSRKVQHNIARRLARHSRRIRGGSTAHVYLRLGSIIIITDSSGLSTPYSLGTLAGSNGTITRAVAYRVDQRQFPDAYAVYIPPTPPDGDWQP
jgi:hypothetical protein